MVEHVLDDVFRALGHPVRRDMVARLALGEATAGELSAPFAISLAASSKHIAVLEQARLLRRTVEGRRHVLRLEPDPLRSAEAWLHRTEAYWQERLDTLAAVLAEDAP